MDRIEVKTAENQLRQEFIRGMGIIRSKSITDQCILVSDKMDKSSTGQ